MKNRILSALLFGAIGLSAGAAHAQTGEAAVKPAAGQQIEARPVNARPTNATIAPTGGTTVTAAPAGNAQPVLGNTTIPEVILESFAQNHRGATNVNWQKLVDADGEKYFVSFDDAAGKRNRAAYKPDGTQISGPSTK